MRESQKACQILLSFLPAIALVMFLYCSKDFISFANSLASTSAWYKMKRIFPAVSWPSPISKDEDKIAEKVLRSSAADKASNWINVGVDTAGEGMNVFRVETECAMSSAGVVKWNRVQISPIIRRAET